MKNEYIAIIQAGGKGTRLRELTLDKIPKPLIALNGKPLIERQILQLKEYGINEFIIIVGHLGNLIEEYFGTGDKLGVNIRYIEETFSLGSAGSLFYAKQIVGTKDVIFVFGDVVFDLDWNRFIDFHENKNGVITLLSHPNAHPYDSDLLITDDNAKVLEIDSKNNLRDYYYHNCVNAGLSIFKNELLNKIESATKIDYEKNLVIPSIKNGEVYAYNSPEYVKDVGTPDRFRKASEEQKKGIWEAKSLKNKQKAIFIDRDGTINVLKGFLNKAEDFELISGTSNAIKRINESEYLAIVITNQPVLARGECTLDELDKIHKKMETLLGEDEAYINDLFYCPHHPDKGFEGEVPELKIDCDCRKPKIGMLLKAAQKYNIDLSQSWFIGDSTVDMQTGTNAGVKTILVGTGEAGKDKKYFVIPDAILPSLYEAVSYILDERE
jgi:D,D-heptose 1,7-bisphosphate phosphatase